MRISQHTVLFLIFAAFAASAAAAARHHAAARLRFNRPFFIKAGNTTKRIIDRIIPELKLPAINASFHNIISFQTRSTNLTEFDFPRTKFKISNSGLIWNSAGGSVGMGMEFVVRVGPFTKTGFLYLTYNDLRMNVSAIVTTSNSRPRLDVTGCDAQLGNGHAVIDADITGYVLSLLKDYIFRYVRTILKLQMCLLITSGSDLANEFVENQPGDIRLHRSIYLNYSADIDPIFSDDYLEATCTFRADLLGSYSDPEEWSEDSESLERNLTQRVVYSMSRSPIWKQVKVGTAELNIRAVMRLFAVWYIKAIVWLLFFTGLWFSACFVWEKLRPHFACSLVFLSDEIARGMRSVSAQLSSLLHKRTDETDPLLSRENDQTVPPSTDSYELDQLRSN
ncbi:hypothetical protein PENTCL1PPCAC_3321 [Pristionchus entomophagus]|uniref:Uncharacterized protein n=1 Tax=Pristionchus entomophagus TaxID=358040 RepID=A0AAV5SCQ1_9BILA|nr:hypothetical protein PENTCL1PPCAC_3321 [Pristionchus entomophagus]